MSDSNNTSESNSSGSGESKNGNFMPLQVDKESDVKTANETEVSRGEIEGGTALEEDSGNQGQYP